MATLHKNLTGSDLHEPKGVAAASADQIYVANGAASGAWTDVADISGPAKAYGNMHISGSYEIENETDWTQIDDFSTGVVSDISYAADALTIATSGVYLINTNITGILHSDDDPVVTTFYLGLGVYSTSWTQTELGRASVLTSTQTPFSISTSTIRSLTATEKIGVFYKDIHDGDIEHIYINTCNMTAILLKAS